MFASPAPYLGLSELLLRRAVRNVSRSIDVFFNAPVDCADTDPFGLNVFPNPTCRSVALRRVVRNVSRSIDVFFNVPIGCDDPDTFGLSVSSKPTCRSVVRVRTRQQM